MKNTEFLKNNGVNLDSALELLGDLSFYDETLVSFIEENKTRLPNIQKYKNEGNMPDYAILVHSLKSDAKYLGFTDLADIAYVHEMASKANNVDEVNAKFNDLVNIYNRYAKIAFEYLGQTSANNENAAQTTHSINNKKKVLVADDSTIISNIVVKAFEGEYDVLVANNGQEAIDATKNNNPDDIIALILDLNMPGVDGFAVLDYFKENDLFKKIPVCIITGDVEKERIDRAFTYPIVDVIPKPFTMDSVRNIVKKISF
jgi:CheY-like chemotaxis protein/HPt (histidine-containing phosphotransfer) domain-containing protein